VLDGGHLFLLTIEAVRRRPMSERAIGIAQRVGLTLIGALILLVFYNDLSRVWFEMKDRFFG
jgi:regulator of sigma E protease